MKCLHGHALDRSELEVEAVCDVCEGKVKVGAVLHRCDECDYDVCDKCFKLKSKKAPTKVPESSKKSLVKQGFLKKTKPSASGSSGSMAVDATQVFAFYGFPKTSDPLVICDLIRERLHDYLPDFSLEVIGAVVFEDFAHVGVKYKVSETESLEAKLYELRERWQFQGEYLNTVTVENPEMFILPVPRAPTVPPGPSPLHASPNRRVVQRVFEQAAPPTLPQVPSLPEGGDAFQATVLASLGQISEFMTTQLVTRANLESYHQEQLRVISNRVDQAVAPINEEIQVLRTRLDALESGSARRRGFSEQPRASDPAFKRIVFKRIPEDMGAHQRLTAIEDYMKTHFAHARVRDIANFYKGKFPDGRSLTRAAYVEFSNSDVRREVLAKIGGGKGEPNTLKCVFNGHTVDIKAAMTENAVQRNASLRRAADVLKADARTTGKVVKVEFAGDRGVTVDKTYVFTQNKDQLTGQFVSVFSDLRLP